MKNGGCSLFAQTVLLLLPALYFFSADGQINELVKPVTFGPFSISSTIETEGGRHFLFVKIFKGSELIVTDSVVTDVAACEGFSVPAAQPFANYFIFSKHQSKGGRTYILTKRGDFTVIGGGTFWAAPKHKLLFILAEKDYRNLVVFNLEQMKTVFEKYSCDEFTDWYYLHGAYFGKVLTECGSEPKTEKEINEWLHPVEIEQYDVKQNALNEMHITDEQVEHAQALVKYAGCR